MTQCDVWLSGLALLKRFRGRICLAVEEEFNSAMFSSSRQAATCTGSETMVMELCATCDASSLAARISLCLLKITSGNLRQPAGSLCTDRLFLSRVFASSSLSDDVCHTLWRNSFLTDLEKCVLLLLELCRRRHDIWLMSWKDRNSVDRERGSQRLPMMVSVPTVKNDQRQ